MPTIEDVLSELAAAPPNGFTRERNALVARLTKLGETKAAERVKAVPRPTAAVWAVNRLARDQRATVEALIAATEQMRRAQLGRGGADLGTASASHRAALARLSARAADLLGEAGLGASHQVRLRIETTLTAAAADPELLPALRVGRLEREVAGRGFEVFAGEKMPPTRAAPAKASGKARPAPRSSASSTEEASQLALPTQEVSTTRREPASVVQLRERVAQVRAARARAEAEEAARRERDARAQRVQKLRQAVEDATRTLEQARHEAKLATEAVRIAIKSKRTAERAFSAAVRDA
jgi:hypothetical protein